MESNFANTDITLVNLQKLICGNNQYPRGGFSDVLLPKWIAPMKKDHLKFIGGNGLIIFVHFTKIVY